MRIRLSHKIFLSFSATFILTCVVMIAMMHFYASWKFSNYIDKMIIDNMDDLVDTLTLRYQKNSNWVEIAENPDAWRQIVAASLDESSFLKRFPPPPPGLREMDHEPMRPNPEPSSARSSHDNPLPPPDHHGPPPFPDFKAQLLRRLSLFDASGNYLAGNKYAPEQNLYREIVLKTEIIGRIGLQKMSRPLSPPEIRFLNQQLKMFSIIGGIMLIFCGLVSYLLANHLMAPVRQLIKGTHAVTNLKFDTRITVYSGDELGQLAQDFNLMAKTLERYEQMQRQWISDIAHELRTPLSIMRGEIEALQDGIRKYSPQLLDSLHDEVMNLAKTVGDLHELSLADSGALHFDQKPVAPVAVLVNTVNHFQTRFIQHRISVVDKLDHASLDYILGDARRLRQLFTNIIENSIRYGTSPMVLTVDQTKMGDTLLLSIEDTGPGVPPKSLERIFDRLYRVDFARSRSGDGSGLGLSICKMIVAAHKGAIRAESGAKGGLKIIMTFPIDPTQKEREDKL